MLNSLRQPLRSFASVFGLTVTRKNDNAIMAFFVGLQVMVTSIPSHGQKVTSIFGHLETQLLPVVVLLQVLIIVTSIFVSSSDWQGPVNMTSLSVAM